MDFKAKLFLVRKDLLDKRNILLMMVMTIIIVVILSALTLFAFFREEMESPENVYYRKISVYKEDSTRYTILNNLDHVEYVLDETYKGEVAIETSLFDSNNQNGYIVLDLFIPNYIKVKGSNNLGENEMVCPKNFYPYNGGGSSQIYFEDYLNANKMIGESYTFNINNEDITLKLVGAYDNIKYFVAPNTCYISKETYNKISFNEDTYLGYDLIVDKYKNLNNVIGEVEALGFKATIHYYNLEERIGITAIPIFTSLVIILISYLILYNFIKKRINYNIHSYGILKACGYKNKDLKKIELLENIILSIPCFILGIIIYTFIYRIIISRSFLVDAIVYGLISPFISIKLVIFSYIIVLLLIYIATKILMKWYLKLSVEVLLKEN